MNLILQSKFSKIRLFSSKNRSKSVLNREKSQKDNSHRTKGLKCDKITDDFNILEQCINSNANTDRGHYHGMLLQQENVDNLSILHKDGLIIKSETTKESKIKKKISKKKIENLKEKHDYEHQLREDREDSNQRVSQNRFNICLEAKIGNTGGFNSR